MNEIINQRKLGPAWIFAISLSLVILNFLWQGHDGFNLWDEGYLWYGARQINTGEIPLRDFMAYDPGRYYWSAAFLALGHDDGIITLRLSVAVFQVLGLWAGLWTIANCLKWRKSQQFIFLYIAAVTLMAWMYPRHKIFDISISMITVGVLMYMLNRPNRGRCFAAGLAVGFAAVFGRNHGVYGALASILAITWLSAAEWSAHEIYQRLTAWAAGVIVGFLPVLLMCLIVPGYMAAFLESILFMLQQGNTNLPLPVPWPWTVGWGTAGALIETRWFLIGLCFIALILFGAASLIWVFRARLKGLKVQPPLVAVACAALPYSHYAFARADVGHLAQGIYPLLLGVFLIAAALRKSVASIAIAALATGMSMFILAAWQPGWLARTQTGWEKVDVGQAHLRVDPSTAEAVKLLRRLTAEYAPNGRSVLVLPFWPGAYPLLNRHAPVWEIYALSPRSEDFQRQEIERIRNANPGFVLVFDMAMDGREELRFSNSHKLINEYIIQNFVQTNSSPDPAYKIYKAMN